MNFPRGWPSFHCSPLPTLPISCSLLHHSISFSCLPLTRQSIVSLACLSFSIPFSTQTLSFSPPPHLFLQYVHTTSIFSASTAPLAILQRHSADHSKHSPLCGSQSLKYPCFHRPSPCPICQHAANTCLIHNTFHSQRSPSHTQYSTKLSKLHPCCPHPSSYSLFHSTCIIQHIA